MAGCGRLFVPVGSINLLNTRCWFINSCQHISMRTKKSIEENLLPKKPKKPLTPFFKYLQIMRPDIITEFPQYKTTEIVKKISEKWVTEDPGYKLKLHQEYDTEYKEYMKKILEYEKSITPEQRAELLVIEEKIRAEAEKAARKRNLESLGKPKKPPSAFLLFIKEMIKTKENDCSIQDFIKGLSSQWKTMSEEDRKKYCIDASKLMDVYLKQKTEWEQNMIQKGHEGVISHKEFSSTAVGRSTDVPDSSINTSSHESFIGQNLVVYEHLLSHSQNYYNLYSTVSCVTKPNFIKKDLMTYVNENDLLKVDKCSKNSALTDYLQTILSRTNTITENIKKHIPKSDEEDNNKSGFCARTLKRLANDPDILKEHL
ncbi:hypothetical protein KPH14_009833 [Odynerus spinipes]|uniref:HMG box domain-containing protein n=1 Tax=Odynerus spinipes TaxID=1348599 RepID=A0AAD9RX75_9HYME|nr:hypothetical protein KPH14_009833 [Odynerus spinipes]